MFYLMHNVMNGKNFFWLGVAGATVTVLVAYGYAKRIELENKLLDLGIRLLQKNQDI